jgi:two-component system sensor histidine kinase BaeS
MLVVFGTDLDLVPWRDVAVRMLWALGLGVLLAAVLAGSLSRFLARRLEGLGSAARRLADGDHAARVTVEGDDEITQVAVAFNDMADQMEESRRREREFLVSVGHDLRTPLTTIGGYAEAMDEGVVPAEDLSRVADVLRRESDRLRRLVEDLMLLSRIEAREFTLRPEPVDLAGHLGGVVDSFRVRAEAAGVDLQCELPTLTRVTVDPDRVAQVVGNLLENALRYTPEGGRVTLTLAEVDGYVRISVADTGPGIDAADLPRIFERLYVAQRYRPVRPEGSGLGLSIVHQLTAAMGGHTEVESESGRGTTVSVVLPPAPPPSTR